MAPQVKGIQLTTALIDTEIDSNPIGEGQRDATPYQARMEIILEPRI